MQMQILRFFPPGNMRYLLHHTINTSGLYLPRLVDPDHAAGTDHIDHAVGLDDIDHDLWKYTRDHCCPRGSH